MLVTLQNHNLMTYDECLPFAYFEVLHRHLESLHAINDAEKYSIVVIRALWIKHIYAFL